MAVCTSDPIIIVGAGALGLSAALHLSQQGYTNISVFEKDNVPSGDSNVHRAAQDAGVQFFFGSPVEEIVYVSTLTGRKNAGVRTRDAQFHPSSLVIIEAGAGVGSEAVIGHFRVHDSLATPPVLVYQHQTLQFFGRLCATRFFFCYSFVGRPEARVETVFFGGIAGVGSPWCD
ncbi:uncharacterized protein N7506_008972 [Penicillium brevicompactum]|uniref:uncharacterized protein n=1 Tax=Penicillium brevicompactum TaxID=5074 RepID=UPI002541D97F|nr:uncharacterized protein N7506_008972 [Penicillium brevicompactum]KAJ5325870.1 hypothetical protein N7506_008972 [Penicillium brevicompactum]